ncbi:hypothetical protein KIF59_12195 [Enterobacter cloacae subsp. cloacae]|nr:hypothetical protein [Enterobacter cloacae subsp. cloacae]
MRRQCAAATPIDLDWLLESTSSQMPLAMDTAARLLIAKNSGCAPASDDYSQAISLRKR